MTATNYYSGAVFNVEKDCRFLLWRRWKSQAKMITFIGLNPSTANENTNDPTIKRVIDFAKRWGYGGVYMINLYPLVTSKPKQLFGSSMRTDDISLNHSHSKRVIDKSEYVVFAWGAFKLPDDRNEQLINMFPLGRCLGWNNNGSPKHPLFVRGQTNLKLYKI